MPTLRQVPGLLERMNDAAEATNRPALALSHNLGHVKHRRGTLCRCPWWQSCQRPAIKLTLCCSPNTAAEPCELLEEHPALDRSTSFWWLAGWSSSSAKRKRNTRWLSVSGPAFTCHGRKSCVPCQKSGLAMTLVLWSLGPCFFHKMPACLQIMSALAVSSGRRAQDELRARHGSLSGAIDHAKPYFEALRECQAPAAPCTYPPDRTIARSLVRGHCRSSFLPVSISEKERWELFSSFRGRLAFPSLF